MSSRDLFELVRIPKGEFQMGGLAEDKYVTGVELPARMVEIQEDFMVGVMPVTEGQWSKVIGGDTNENDGELPVVRVSFREVKAFCERVGNDCRLMSEAEWEYVCRGGGVEIFGERGVMDVEDGNYLYDELGHRVGKGGRSSSGEYPLNGFGVFDMLGNVCEWVEDVWHACHTDAAGDGTARLDGGEEGCRVIRGGGWDHLPRMLRASWRDKAREDVRWDNLGFRVAFDLKEEV